MNPHFQIIRKDIEYNLQYSIKRKSYTFTISKIIELDNDIEAWFTKYNSCDYESEEKKISYTRGFKEVKISLPNAYGDFSKDYGLYKLHIRVGNHYQFKIIPFYPNILKSLVEDLEKLLCGCPCNDCDNCTDDSEYLNTSLKTMLYYSLSGNYYSDTFGKAIKCVDCDLDEKAVCMLLNEKIYGNSFNKETLKKILAIFYLSFYFMENFSNCDTEYANNIFDFEKIKPCLKKLNIDIECIKKQLKNKQHKFGDNFITTENRTPIIIRKKDLLETSPSYADKEPGYIDFIKIKKINLGHGDNSSDMITLKGTPIYEGQLISILDIENNQLVYTPRDTNRSSESWFTWEAVDSCDKTLNNNENGIP